MSDDHDWDDILRQFEGVLGHPLPSSVREDLNRRKPQVLRIIRSQGGPDQWLKITQWHLQKSPLVAFAWKLKARQGTVMPDFEALYRRKAELDHDSGG